MMEAALGTCPPFIVNTSSNSKARMQFSVLSQERHGMRHKNSSLVSIATRRRFSSHIAAQLVYADAATMKCAGESDIHATSEASDEME